MNDGEDPNPEEVICSIVNRILLVFYICAVWLSFSSRAFAGAWTQQKNGYYFKIATNYLKSTDNLDSDGNEVPKPGMGTLKDLNFSAYLEYGVLDHLTLVATIPYKRLSDTRTFTGGIGKERVTGFSDLEVRLRRGLMNQALVTSIALGGKFPAGYEVDDDTRVPLGTTKVDADIRLLVGRSFYPVPGYSTGEFGYRIRGGQFSDEIFYALEAGLAVNRFLLKGLVTGVRTLGTCGAVGQANLIGDQNILKLSPGVTYLLRDNVELSLEIVHTASGCNTTAGSTMSLGVALKR